MKDVDGNECDGNGRLESYYDRSEPATPAPTASAREFRKAWSHKPTPIPAENATNELWYSESCAEQLMEAYASSQAEKLRGVGQQAAEKIERRFNLNDGATEAVEPELAAIIDAEIEGRLKK